MTAVGMLATTMKTAVRSPIELANALPIDWLRRLHQISVSRFTMSRP